MIKVSDKSKIELALSYLNNTDYKRNDILHPGDYNWYSYTKRQVVAELQRNVLYWYGDYTPSFLVK